MSPDHAESAKDQPWVSWSFLAICVLITVPSLFLPGLREQLGGIEPRRHGWQVFTAVFVHGWPGFPGAVHLLLNAFLILECGRPCERLLGHRRFLALSVLSWLANALAIHLTEGVNGSSLIIWSWGPPLFWALRCARREDPRVAAGPGYLRIRGILVLMYGVITLAMGLLPYFFGWRGNLLLSLLRANTFHLVATAVGVAFTIASSGVIRRRMLHFEFESE